jgi:transcriptional regulator with XRE-family HTH domain
LGKIVFRARQARLAYSVKVGRSVTVQEVARAIGVSRETLSNVERGITWPSRRVVEGLCRVYGVTPGDLLVYEERLARYLAPA